MRPHTKAKHEILKEYLKAWFPILTTYNQRIIYIDGFAGPGIYSGGEEGSPLVAIRTAIDHTQKNRFNKIFFVFIEKDQKRAEILQKTVSDRFPTLPTFIELAFYNSEFKSVLSQILSYIEEKDLKLAPTLAFIDPFGFKGFPTNLVSKLLSNPRTEVLITFMSSFIKRNLDARNAVVLDDLFGCDDWKKVLSINRNKDAFLLGIYTKQLQRNVDGKLYTRTFGMEDQNDRHIYDLIFATRNLKGLDVMKRVMVKIDTRGIYKFSDKTDPHQRFLFNYMGNENAWISTAANFVFEKFKGKKASLKEISDSVISETPYVFKKKILESLERSIPEKILAVDKRTRSFTYPDKYTITFAS